ncbi:hypothetical protein ANCDUO_00934 [Ancylostoma duodenale]|uniref:Lipid-binding serum glycoprotein N-terminal domain-containing protein n=1 Tax=Ancylostoma duodenale TaxID=51022 RepID=A0A0C2HAR9_9BILA|nr:hypothetical protein ANCDUO_00934 [Ancylostoma duodenale]
MDMELKWDDFEFTPKVTMKADLKIRFTDSLKAANMFKDKVQEISDHFVEKTLPEMITNIFEKQVNPLLRKFKNMLTGMGLSQFGVEFMVQNGNLRIAVKPKSALGKVDPIKPINQMVCISSDLLAAVIQLKRSKRQAVNSNGSESKFGIDLTCSTPEGSCTESSCSFCADLDIKESTKKSGFRADFGTCVPKNL